MPPVSLTERRIDLTAYPIEDTTRREFITGVGAAALAAAFLAACGGDDSDEQSDTEASEAAGYPVRIEHVYGVTVIESKPERVATVAWANHEVPLALGVVPVGMSKVDWGDDDEDGMLPWVEDRLAELSAEPPVLFDETNGIDFEAVANTRPDVILASYSGITQDEYDKLSQIAPTVAYPDVPWGATLQEMILINSKAMGLEDEGKQFLADLEEEITATFAGYQQLVGKKVWFGYIDPSDLSQIGYYTTHDSRPAFTSSVGMATPQLIAEKSAEVDGYYTISAEQAYQLADVDIFVTTGNASTLEAMQADPLLATVPAIAEGRVVILEDSTPLAASANPTPLSIGWGLDAYFGLFAAAVDGG